MPTFRLSGRNHNIGSTLDAGDLRDLLSTGYTPSSIIDKAKQQGFKIGDGAKELAGSWSPPTSTITSSAGGGTQSTQAPFANSGTSAPTGVSRDEGDYLFQSGLINLQGDIQKELESLRGATSIRIAEIGAGATVRSGELDREARENVAKIMGESEAQVETIRGTNNVNLQAIINAGNDSVEQIRERTALGVGKLTGEYNLQQEQERQRGQKEIANIGSASSLRNALVGAFSF